MIFTICRRQYQLRWCPEDVRRVAGVEADAEPDHHNRLLARFVLASLPFGCVVAAWSQAAVHRKMRLTLENAMSRRSKLAVDCYSVVRTIC
jgi:hypothetical protein